MTPNSALIQDCTYAAVLAAGKLCVLYYLVIGVYHITTNFCTVFIFANFASKPSVAKI